MSGVSVKCLYDFSPRSSTELELHRNDIISDVIKANGDWWWGSMNGKEGYFPANYVIELSQTSRTSPRASANGTIPCPLCGECFATNIIAAHASDCVGPPVSNEETFTCPICNKKFSQDEIETHASQCEEITLRKEDNTLPKKDKCKLPLPDKSSDKKKKEIDDLKCCKQCWEKESNLLFLPCAHLCTCESCGNIITSCMICHKSIERKIRIYPI